MAAALAQEFAEERQADEDEAAWSDFKVNHFIRVNSSARVTFIFLTEKAQEKLQRQERGEEEEGQLSGPEQEDQGAQQQGRQGAQVARQ